MAKVAAFEAVAIEAEELALKIITKKRAAEKAVPPRPEEVKRLEDDPATGVKVVQRHAHRMREKADAAQQECERRGRARIMNHDECPQAHTRTHPPTHPCTHAPACLAQVFVHYFGPFFFSCLPPHARLGYLLRRWQGEHEAARGQDPRAAACQGRDGDAGAVHDAPYR